MWREGGIRREIERNAGTCFQFQYTVFLVEARKTNTHLIVKMGIKHIQVPLEQVEFIFLDDQDDWNIGN